MTPFTLKSSVTSKSHFSHFGQLKKFKNFKNFCSIQICIFLILWGSKHTSLFLIYVWNADFDVSEDFKIFNFSDPQQNEEDTGLDITEDFKILNISDPTKMWKMQICIFQKILRFWTFQTPQTQIWMSSVGNGSHPSLMASSFVWLAVVTWFCMFQYYAFGPLHCPHAVWLL